MTTPSPLASDSGLLLPIEQKIVALVEELTALIAEVVDETDHESPLGEFDQRLLLEHAQIIERYVLAQAAARAYPDRYRLIGQPAPGWEGEAAGPNGATTAVDAHRHSHGGGDSEHHHGRHPGDDPDHEGAGHEHHVADADAAREAHRLGRAILGEHPWEQEHAHDDGHAHADEWDWEPIGDAPELGGPSA